MSITNNNLITKLKKFRTIYQSSDPSITPETITWGWQLSANALAESHSFNITNLQSQQNSIVTSSTSSAAVSKASDPADTTANSITLYTANFLSAMQDDAEPVTTDTEALYRVLAIVEGRIAYNKTLINYFINPKLPKADKEVFLASIYEIDTSAFFPNQLEKLIKEFSTGCTQDANHYCMIRDFILSHLQTENKHFLDQLYFTIELLLESNYEELEKHKKLANVSVKHSSLKTVAATSNPKTKKFSTKTIECYNLIKEIEHTNNNSRNFELVHYREILTLLKPFLSEDNREFSQLINTIRKEEATLFTVGSCQKKIIHLIKKTQKIGLKLQKTIEGTKFKEEFAPTMSKAANFIYKAIEKITYKTIDETSITNEFLVTTTALLCLREAHSHVKKARNLIAECRAKFKKRLVDEKKNKHPQETAVPEANSAASATQPNRPPSLSSLSASKLSDKEALADYYFSSCSPSSASPTRISPLKTTAAGSPTAASAATTATTTYSTAAATAAAASAYEPASASQPSIASSHAADQAFTPAASAHLKEAQLKGKTDTAVNTKKLSKEENEQLNFLYNRLTSTQQETLANLLRDDYNDKGNCISLSNIQSLIEGSKADGRKTGGLLGRVIETKGGSSHYCCQLPNTYQNWTIVKMRNVYGYFDIPTTKGPGLHAKDKQHIPIAAIEHARETLTRAGITKERLEMAGIKLNIGEPACKK